MGPSLKQPCRDGRPAPFRQKGVWSPMHIDHFTFYGPSQYLSSFLSNMPNFHFWLISLSIPPKKVSNSFTLNFDATDLPHSYVVWTVIPQNFQGYPKSQPSVISLASSTLQSQPIRKVVHDFRCFLVFFWHNRFSRAKLSTLHSYSESYCFDG